MGIINGVVNSLPPAARPNLASPYAPTAQDFADQLAQLQKTAPGRIRTAGALGTNLLADALLQYGQDQARQSGAQGQNGSPATPIFPAYRTPNINLLDPNRPSGPSPEGWNYPNNAGSQA